MPEAQQSWQAVTSAILTVVNSAGEMIGPAAPPHAAPPGSPRPEPVHTAAPRGNVIQHDLGLEDLRPGSHTRPGMRQCCQPASGDRTGPTTSETTSCRS